MILKLIKTYRSGVKPLTISTKSRLKNLIGAVILFGALIFWSTMFFIHSIYTFNIILFTYFWEVQKFLLISYLGFFLAFTFLSIMWIAIYTMGKSWRIGVDDKHPDDLITHGIFRFSRNPIFLGLNGIVISGFLIHPNLFFLFYSILTVIFTHIQILIEEKHLKKIYGEKYEEYMKKTKRYFLFF
jgi:protein-S-isoprenylcysteine O-methyltransferase Ste14